MRKIITLLIIIILAMPNAFAQKSHSFPATFLTFMCDVPLKYVDTSIEVQFISMRNNWFGIGGGFGGITSKDFFSPDKENNVKLLGQDNEIEHTSAFMEATALLSPELFRIRKVAAFFEFRPSLRLETRYSVKYGYLDRDGIPRIGKYSSLPVSAGSYVGIGLRLGKWFYIGGGYAISTGNGGKCEVKYHNGNPKLRRCIMQGRYFTIGYRL